MSNRTRKLRIAFGFATLVSLLGTLLAGLIVYHGRDSAPTAVLVVAIAAILGAAVAAMLPWWRRLDHMQRDSHLTSWYWGGSFGGGFGLLSLVVIGNGDAMAQGGAVVWIAQMIGYAVAFIGWKIAHRAGET